MFEIALLIVGGIIGWGGAHLEARQQRSWRLRSLKAALAVEVRSLVEMVRRQGYEQELRDFAADLTAPANLRTFDTYSIHAPQSYFTIFEANASDIGQLEPRLAVEVVAFYLGARSWLDGVASEVAPEIGPYTPKQAAALYIERADLLAQLCQFGDALAGRLSDKDVAAHITSAATALNPSR